MNKEIRDPWVDVKTYHGFSGDQVISALQKEIRRGNTENAVLLAYEMVITSPAMEDYLWQRLMVISVEDIGFGQLEAPIFIHSLHQMNQGFDRNLGERKLFAVHAVRYLCNCQKDRSSDEMIMWIKMTSEKSVLIPEIPDYALDMHTKKGKELGRGIRHFLDVGTQLSPELAERDLTYKDRIVKILEF